MSSATECNSKRIFLVTDDDDPHKDDPALAKSAITRAKDLNDVGVRIEPLFISSPTKRFDVSRFYEVLIFFERVCKG